jgi:hypothetical protein
MPWLPGAHAAAESGVAVAEVTAQYEAPQSYRVQLGWLAAGGLCHGGGHGRLQTQHDATGMHVGRGIAMNVSVSSYCTASGSALDVCCYAETE